MSLDLPSNRSEAWRWSDLSALPELLDRAPSGRVPDALPWIEVEGPRLLFVDGKLDESRSRLGPIEIGWTRAKSREHPLARLTHRHGWTLTLGKEHASTGLVQIIHVSTGGSDHIPSFITLADDTQASVLETFVGDGWANRLTTILLFPKSRLMLSRRLLGSGGFVSIVDNAMKITEGASFVSTTLAVGGMDTRLETTANLAGPEAYAEVSAALLGRRRQRHDANCVIRHEMPGGTSRQLWRSVADDSAACSVAARVEVARGAQKTDAEQSLKGLLLNRGATINAKPELEIFADDVKCAHGAAVGELDERALFYLESRGVTPGEAKALLTRAFVADAIDRVGEDEVRAAFYADAQGWFGGGE